MKPIALLIRHGDTDMTDLDVFVSRSDFPLNAKGHKQAEEALEFIRKQGDFDEVYSSPLIRCFEMAQMYADEEDIIQHRGLLPWDRGVFTGIPETEGEDSLKIYMEHPDIKIPFGESRIDAEKRIGEFFEATLDRLQSKKLRGLFFTHHSVIDILNYLCEGERSEKMENVVEVGGVAGIFVDGDGYRLEALLNGSPKYEPIS